MIYIHIFFATCVLIIDSLLLNYQVPKQDKLYVSSFNCTIVLCNFDICIYSCINVLILYNIMAGRL